MRVVIVQHGAFPGFVAPTPKELAKHLHRLGVDVSVASVGDYSKGNGTDFSFPVHRLHARRAWQAYPQLKRVVENADIVHYFPGSGLELLPLLNRRAKYIFNHISVSVTGNALRDGVIDFAKRLQTAFADLVIATDQPLADALRPIIPTPIELLPVGYPADLFHPCAPFEDGAERLLLYHGACRPQRRLDQVIRMIARLPDRYRLMIIGGGSPRDEAYRAQLGGLAEQLGCSRRVVLTNMQQREIRAVIERAYLCISYVPVMECFTDQFVLKTLEYLACQRPVLTTDTRYNLGFQRQIGADMLRISNDGVDALTAAVLDAESYVRAFHQPASLRRLSALLEPYSSAAVVEQKLLPIYRRLLASN